jgi:hypothetical protein
VRGGEQLASQPADLHGGWVVVLVNDLRRCLYPCRHGSASFFDCHIGPPPIRGCIVKNLDFTTEGGCTTLAL